VIAYRDDVLLIKFLKEDHFSAVLVSDSHREDDYFQSTLDVSTIVGGAAPSMSRLTEGRAAGGSRAGS
jgi:hypothetical protein